MLAVAATILAPAAGPAHAGYFGDVMATFAQLAGAKPPGALDSLSLVPTLLGRGAQARQDYLYWEFYEGGLQPGCAAGRAMEGHAPQVTIGTDPALRSGG